MGLFDGELHKHKVKKQPPPLPPPDYKVPTLSEALQHYTVVRGTHKILVCSRRPECMRWFRYGREHIQDSHTRKKGMRCECGKGMLVRRTPFVTRTRLRLEPKCDQYSKGVCLTLSTKKQVVRCPLERAANALNGDCISHSRYQTRQRMLALFKRSR